MLWLAAAFVDHVRAEPHGQRKSVVHGQHARTERATGEINVNHDVAVLGAHGENAVETGRLGEDDGGRDRVTLPTASGVG